MYFPIDAGAFGDAVTFSGAALVVRGAHDAERLALPIQKVIQQMNRELAVSDVLTMNQIINQSSLDADFEATLLAAFAGISLLLAAVGLFGVLAYLVTQRRTEIGIRLALGAQRAHVLHLMLLDGLAPALGGAAALFAVIVQLFVPIAAGSTAYGLFSALLLGAVLGLVGIFGDLTESLLKRDSGCKDASQAVPGYGGVLDVVDSILFAAPVVYWWLA